MSELHDKARALLALRDNAPITFDCQRLDPHSTADIIRDLLAENERLTGALSERQAHWRDAVIRADAAKVRLREIQTENERLRADRDALHKMTRCQCSDDDACAFAVRAIAAESRLRELCEMEPLRWADEDLVSMYTVGAEGDIPLIRRPEMPSFDCMNCGGTGDVSGEYPGRACPACSGTGRQP